MKEILEKLERADKLLAVIPASGDIAILLVGARQELGTAYKALTEQQGKTDAAS